MLQTMTTTSFHLWSDLWYQTELVLHFLYHSFAGEVETYIPRWLPPNSCLLPNQFCLIWVLVLLATDTQLVSGHSSHLSTEVWGSIPTYSARREMNAAHSVVHVTRKNK